MIEGLINRGCYVIIVRAHCMYVVDLVIDHILTECALLVVALIVSANLFLILINHEAVLVMNLCVVSGRPAAALQQ